MNSVHRVARRRYVWTLDAWEDLGRAPPLSTHVSWELVATFLVLVEELRLGATADRLGISRQTLARRIQELEAQLDTQLIVRTTRRVELTSAGAVLRERATPIAEALDRLAEQVHRARAGLRLSVGISTDLTTAWDARVEAWVQQRAMLAVIERRAPDDAMRVLRAGEMDLLVIAGELADEPGSVVVGHEPTVVVFPATHPAATGRAAIRAGELRDLPVAVSDAGTVDHHRQAVEQLHGDPELPYLVAPRIGTIAPGLVQAARTHRAAALVLARSVERLDLTGLAALPMDPQALVPVVAIARPGLPAEQLRSFANHLLSAPPA